MKVIPAISFSVTTSRGPAWKLILDGEKTCTTRKARLKGRPEAGLIASLYWKQRQPRVITFDGGGEKQYSKPIHKVGEAYITKVRRISSLKAVWGDKEYAAKEGFSSLEEMRHYWVPQMPSKGQYTLEMQPLIDRILAMLGPMDIITWQYPLKENGKLL